MRIGVVANTSWYLHNFRGNLIRALRSDGHTLLAIGGVDDEHAVRLRAAGIQHRPVAFSGSGTHPLRELGTVAALRRVVVREGVELVLSNTPKGNIYSAMALFGLPTQLVMNISGLGMAFARDDLLAATVRMLYKVSFRRAAWMFFQNGEDLSQFRARNLVDASCVSRLPGSGVDLAAFRPPVADARAPGHESPLFLLVGRLLWDKGIGEFVEAARRVKAIHPKVRFRLLGAIPADHRAGVPRAKLDEWVAAGLVEYPGAVDDVRPHLQAADCVVLPSVYREGVPRSLLEAAAMGRPIIATDSVGCRDAVDSDVSGFLCRPRDPDDLAQKMLRLLAMNPEARRRMGEAGRAKMEREFDERLVIDAYRQRVDALGACRSRS